MVDETFSSRHGNGVALDAGLIAARLGGQVHAWRQEASISEADLAATLRLTVQAVRSAGNGDPGFTPEQLVSICDAYNVSPSRFLGSLL